MEADLEERLRATLSPGREFLRRACEVSVSDSTLSKILRRIGWSRKKVNGSERGEWLRAAWRVMVAGEAGLDAGRLVFVDEMGDNIPLAPL